jgi:putative ABC transport system permease protein
LPLSTSPVELLLALRMLLYKKVRFLLTVLGIGVAFFLSAAQVGLLVGWSKTTSAVIRHADADVWVMARQTPALDYGTPIPRSRVYEVRNVAGVAWAEGMFMGWNTWQRPDGRRVTVEMIGLDDGSVGGPWKMKVGEPAVVHRPETVIVDEVYARSLGVSGPGDEALIQDLRAVVGGLSQEVRTFTAAPFVFTSLGSAIKYDKRYRDDEVTFVLVRCAPGFRPERVRDAIAREVPNVEVLTSRQFAVRSVAYWMLETGIGITVLLTAALGLVVGLVVASQTLFSITQDHLPNYATLLALGFSRWQLVRVVLLQSLQLGAGGVLVGSAAFSLASCASTATPIPVETTPPVYAGLVAVSLLSCLLASFLSVRSLFRVDPVAVFRT